MSSLKTVPLAVRPARWDVIIVGAGPAGLSAALLLGRCCRRVLLCDAGTPRNWAARRVNAFLTRDGMDIQGFRQAAQEQLSKYPNVRMHHVTATQAARCSESVFAVQFGDSTTQYARKLLLASGVLDDIPKIPGIQRYLGISVHSCPYCDAWETRDQPVAVYGKGRRGFEMARAMTAWSNDVLLCTDGPAHLSLDQLQALHANQIDVVPARITGLGGEGGELRDIHFADGSRRARRSLYFDLRSHPQSVIAQQLGCRMTRSGKICCGEYEASSVPGVYAAGNVLEDVQLSIVAAAEGARAAFGINRALTREDFSQASAERVPNGPFNAEAGG